MAFNLLGVASVAHTIQKFSTTLTSNFVQYMPNDCINISLWHWELIFPKCTILVLLVGSITIHNNYQKVEAALLNFKAFVQLDMEILHFKDLGDTECRLAANAVVLVLGKFHVSIATYLKGYIPSYKVVLQCIGICHFKSSRAETHTDTHNDRHTFSIQ